MKTNKLRAEITLVLVLVIALGGAAAFGGYKWGRNSVDKDNQRLAREATAALAAAQESQKRALEAKQAHEEAVKADAAQDQSTAGFALGTKIALEADSSSSPNIKIAQVMNEQVIAALPPPTDQQNQEFARIIQDLLARQATTSVELQNKVTEAGVLKTNLTTAQKQAADANNRAVEATETVVNLTQKVDAQARELADLAGQNKDLWWHIKLWGGIALGLWLASLILPPLAKSFPALQPLASLVGAIWAPGVHLVSAGARKLSQDMVAFHEFTKTEMEKAFGEKSVSDFKKLAKTWWGDDVQAQTEIERIKKQVLRT